MKKHSDDSILFQADYSTEELTKTEKLINSETLTSTTKTFVDLAISLARKMKANIIIKDEGCTSIELYIQIGTFFDGFKSMFLALATLSDDFLILPINKDSKFTLKIRLQKKIVFNSFVNNKTIL